MSDRPIFDMAPRLHDFEPFHLVNSHGSGGLLGGPQVHARKSSACCGRDPCRPQSRLPLAAHFRRHPRPSRPRAVRRLPPKRICQTSPCTPGHQAQGQGRAERRRHRQSSFKRAAISRTFPAFRKTDNLRVQQCTDAPDPKFPLNGVLACVFRSPQPLSFLNRRAFQARPRNSAPPPRAGAAVGSKSSGFFAISVCVVRISPATDAALRTAL